MIKLQRKIQLFCPSFNYSPTISLSKGLIRFHVICILYDVHYHSNLPQVLANTVFLTISTSEMLSKLSTWTSTPTGIAGPAKRGESTLLTDMDCHLIYDKTCFPPQCISPLSLRSVPSGLGLTEAEGAIKKMKIKASFTSHFFNDHNFLKPKPTQFYHSSTPWIFNVEW